MKLLLDTHVWLWSRLSPRKVPRNVASALGKSTNELWLSPVSIWEIMMLCRKGRLKLDPDPVQWVESALAVVPMREAPVTQQVAMATRGISLPHADPIDLLLAATANVYGLTLVTADEQLLSGRGYPVFGKR